MPMVRLFKEVACGITALTTAYFVGRTVERDVTHQFARAAESIVSYASPTFGAQVPQGVYDMSSSLIGAASGAGFGLAAGIVGLRVLQQATKCRPIDRRHTDVAESVAILNVAAGIVGLGAQGALDLLEAVSPSASTGLVGAALNALLAAAYTKSALSAGLLVAGRTYTPRLRRFGPHP